ncbi:MAG: transglutaminase-like protease [Candidatus Pacearchaeota archaeon]|nr:MAG: transglutaminase-like protease [Candidatus Pacearchaeota archaeon]
MFEFLLKFRLFRKFQEKQFLPTKEDIDDKEVKKLANRLKGKNDSETLNNILEWQDKNVDFWEERWLMFILLVFLSFFSIAGLYILLPSSILLRAIILILIIVGIVFSFYIFLNYLVILTSYILSFIVILITINPISAIKVFNLFLIVILSLSSGGIISLILYLNLKYRILKLNHPEFKLKDTFKFSLSTNEIIKYRLAVCRDYAKLTSALLLNLYPKNKIYFVLIPCHVAVAININKTFYVIDQKMPISSLETWLKRWKKRRAILLSIVQNKNKLKTEFFKTITLKDRGEIKRVLDEKMVKELERSINNKKRKFEFVLKDYSSLYDLNDGVIKESLIRTIRNKIESEFLSKLGRIKNIEINQDGKDLILKVFLNKTRNDKNTQPTKNLLTYKSVKKS